MLIAATQWKRETEGVITKGIGFIGSRICALDLPAVLVIAGAMEIMITRTLLARLRTFESLVLALASSHGKTSPGEIPCTPAKKEICARQYGHFLEWTCKNCPQNQEKADG
jgi:hypothetical protein